jgi:DNA-binding LytR/AlgR family response regulator
MRILIIEDELPARAKLEEILLRLYPETTIVAFLGSVKDTLLWLSGNEEPDVAFVDIQLSDDHSFEIFRKHPVNFPVIFTTAYDKYILESFEFNSIDYLLKPITEVRVKQSLEKLQLLKKHFLQGNFSNLINDQRTNTRIIGKKGTEFIALDLHDIAYFFTEHKIVFVRDFSGRQLLVNKSLAEIEQTIDKEKFFRLNRKFIVQLCAIEKFKPDNGKIKIFLKPQMKEDVHVSKETAPAFRAWIAGVSGSR